MTSSHAENRAIERSGHCAIFNHSMTQSPNHSMFSLVRNHPQHFAEISIAHQAGLAHLPLGFGFLGRQDVTQFRMSPLHLSLRRLLEALRSALVCFQFRHKNPQETAVSFQPSAVSYSSYFQMSDGRPDFVIPSGARNLLLLSRFTTRAWRPAPEAEPGSMHSAPRPSRLSVVPSRVPCPISSEPGSRA